MNNLLIVSNSCVGLSLYKKLNLKYTSPFIGTLIPNDLEFIRLCNNIIHYINMIPVVSSEPKENTIFEQQSRKKYYNHPSIMIPYPIIHLGDVEIHCIHENNCISALEKFDRRRNRFLDIIRSGNYRIVSIWSMSEMFNDHCNISDVVCSFINGSDDNIFLGSSVYKIDKKNYIEEKNFNGKPLNRNDSFVYFFNDQEYLSRTFLKFLTDKISSIQPELTNNKADHND
jgi:hypothetical protein